MKKALWCVALLAMLGLPVFSVSAAETIGSCLDDPPVNPLRDAECAGLLLLSNGPLPLTAERCTGIIATTCSIPLFPCPVLKTLTVQCAALGYDTARRALCDQGPRGDGCCIEKVESPQIAIADGKCVNEVEDCKVGGKISYSCCVCDIPLPGGNNAVRKIMDSRQTYSSCEEVCKKQDPNAKVYRQAGAGSLPPPPASSNAPTAAQLQEKLATCFTPQDCASAEYGGSADAFRAGQGCPSGQGRCVAPEPEIKLSYPIGNITTVKGFRNFVAAGFNFGVNMAAVAAAVMFVYGGFRYIFGSAFTNVKRAKEIMVDAAIGLALTLGAITILQTVNKDTLNFSRIEVFMINKSQLLSSKFCSDIKLAKPIQFADAGPRPAYTPIDKITAYTVAGEETRCNYDYYGDGLDQNRCAGRKCDNAGEACVSCKSGACKTGADPLSYECVKANWAGTISFADEAYVDALTLYAVCNSVVKAPDIMALAGGGILNNGIEEITAAKVLGQTDGSSGTQTYTFEIKKEDLDGAKEECNDKGGLAGFVMAVEYNDTSLLGGNDEAAVIGKSNCGGVKFAGYLDGTANPFEAELAIMCGLAVPSKPLANPSSYWSIQDLEKAIGISDDPKPISCDLQLNSTNAPTDPGTKSKPQVTFNVANKKYLCGIP